MGHEMMLPKWVYQVAHYILTFLLISRSVVVSTEEFGKLASLYFFMLNTPSFLVVLTS